MKSVNISIDSLIKAKDFVNTLNKLEGVFDISSERYLVDARSIMGILSLDLTKCLRLDVHNEENFDNTCEALKGFIVE